MASPDKSRRYDPREKEGFHMNSDRHNRDGKYDRNDDPPHSRLFIVCGKSITEDDFREEFSKYGKIEEVWMVKDKVTDTPKGVTYVKFSKTSEAALAMEEMNGRCIGTHPRPLKVLIAHSREQGSRREMNEEERLLRLFVVVPKALTEAELRETFAQYGDIDYVSIVRERQTRESKGFGYVKYHRMSHAATAFEECDRTYKPVFADPKPPKDMVKFDGSFRGGGGAGSLRDLRNESYGGGQRDFGVDSGVHNPEGVTRLTVVASISLNQDQLWRLFDLIPGLDYCELRRDRKSGQQARGFATVVYNNIQSAVYARDKLHGFEYPPGQRLIVRLEGHSHGSHDMASNSGAMHSQNVPFSNMNRGLLNNPNGSVGQSMRGGQQPLMPSHSIAPSRPNSNNLQQDLAAQLAETIAQASSLIQAANMSQQSGNPGSPMMGGSPSPGPGNGETYDPSYCSVKLLAPQPLAPVDSPVAERLFIICYPNPPPIYVLKDVFGRFGNLIDIYMLNGKTFGYAKFASKESADRAIQVLHGQEIMGARMKVMQAEPQEKGDPSRKRMKMDEN